MKGYIRNRAKNTWQIIFDVPRGADGKHRQKWISVKGTGTEYQAQSKGGALCKEA